jgi:hypothetical protein
VRRGKIGRILADMGQNEPRRSSRQRGRRSAVLRFSITYGHNAADLLTEARLVKARPAISEPFCRQVRFALSKAVAGQYRAAGTVQSMSTQAIRDGETTALYAAAAIPRHIRAASPLLCRGAGLSKDR